VVAEILYGLQARTEAGSKTWDHFLRPLCDRLRADGAQSLEVFAGPAKFETLAHTKAMRSVVRTMLVWLTRLGATRSRNAERTSGTCISSPGMAAPWTSPASHSPACGRR
jgi:hypothetical protein